MTPLLHPPLQVGQPAATSTTEGRSDGWMVSLAGTSHTSPPLRPPPASVQHIAPAALQFSSRPLHPPAAVARGVGDHGVAHSHARVVRGCARQRPWRRRLHHRAPQLEEVEGTAVAPVQVRARSGTTSQVCAAAKLRRSAAGACVSCSCCRRAAALAAGGRCAGRSLRSRGGVCALRAAPGRDGWCCRSWQVKHAASAAAATRGTDGKRVALAARLAFKSPLFALKLRTNTPLL